MTDHIRLTTTHGAIVHYEGPARLDAMSGTVYLGDHPIELAIRAALSRAEWSGIAKVQIVLKEEE